MNADVILDSYFDEMTQTLRKVISFNSEKSAPASGAPFGKGAADCLTFVLKTAKSWGLDVVNCDGYAGHVDLAGSGKEILGILGHLDVVPAGKTESWKYPPFDGVIENGKLYGRGAMDDKGPMIACLYAVKALKEAGFKPQKTVRLIFGCDEESGMGCVDYYFRHMPKPDVSFSPDGDFPVINREKGIYQFEINLGKLPQTLISFTAGERANVVPDECVVKIAGKITLPQSENLSVQGGGNVTTLTFRGKSAHASTPAEGKNATWDAFCTLSALYPDSSALKFAATKLTDYTGKKWGTDLHDEESGDLTANVGVAKTEGGNLLLTVDVRYPVTFTAEEVRKVFAQNTPFAITSLHESAPLYVRADSDLVSTLIDVYNEKTGSNASPIAIGGGTYSRCLPNCVAFGPLFPKEEQTIHMPNENIILENLRKMAHIYLEAIRRLSK